MEDSFEEIEHIVAHELSHIREPHHKPPFYEEQEKSKLAGFKAPHGVVNINGGSSSKDQKPDKPVKTSKTHCSYHLCGKKAKLEKCGYCGNYYCKEHIMPKEPGHYNVDGSESPILRDNPEWKNTDGHPCAPFLSYMEQKRKEEDERYREGLKRATSKRKVRTFEQLIPFSSRKTKEEKPKRHSIKERHVKHSTIEKPKEEHIKTKPVKPIRKFPIKVVIIGVLLVLILSGLANKYLVPSDCNDETLHNSCSTNKPYFCIDGEFIEDIEKCGCPDGTRVFNNECIEIVKCIDGTLHPECSVDKPYQCLDGNLVFKASVCGCPEGEYIEGEYCKKII